MKNKTFFKINLIYFTALICVAVVFVLGYAGIITNDWLSTFLIQIVIMFAIPMLMYSLLVSKSPKKTFSNCGFKKISGKMVLISFLLGFALYFINNFVANVFSGIISSLGYENLYSGTTVTLTYGLVLKEFLLSAILPGFCEEFLHRGVMLLAGKKTGNPRYVLIISSILFGLTHLNINQFFYAAILGFLMGYVALSADSIFPSMIIHFMNNFLGTYLYYGYYLNWPVATFITEIESILMSNIVLYVAVTSIFVALMIFLYIYLTRQMQLLRIRQEAKKILIELSKQETPDEGLQTKLNTLNAYLEQNSKRFTLLSVPKGKKYSFFEKSFMISSIILGVIITISTFIWGIL